MTKQTWVWNKFYGGLGDYSNIVTDTDMTKYGNDSYSIDGRRNPQGVCLTQYLTKAEYSVSGDITAYLDLAEFGGSGIVAITNDKLTNTSRVYLNGTLKYTFTVETFDLSVLKIGTTQYIYYFGPYGVHRSDITCTPASFIQDHRTFTNQGYAQTKILNYANNIYFTSGNYLNILSGTTELVTEGVCVLSQPYIITGILLYQDYLRIYGKSQTNGILAIWKRNSGNSLPNYIVTYPGLPVRGATGDSGVDYVIMGYSDDYSDLYLINGQEKPQMLISNPEGDINERKFNGVISTRGGLVYLGGKINGNNCLFSYGKYHRGYPESLQVEGYVGNVTAIYPRSTDILFGNNDNGTTYSGIQYIGDRTGFHRYIDIGEVVSLEFDGGIRTVKNIQTVEIYFNNDTLSTYNKFGGTINFYARTKKSNAWTLVKTINTTTNTKGFIRITRQEFGNLGSFNQLEYKIRLNATLDGGSYKISPLVTSIITVYDDNLNK